MLNIPKAFPWAITIYYEDTDAGGIVYHSNYLKFFERARTEMLRTMNFSQKILLDKNIGLVVRHMDIDFISSAKLDDHLIVESSVIEIKKVSLLFQQEIKNSANVILCKATTKIACVDTATVKLQKIPQSIIDGFNRISAWENSK